MAQSSTGMRGMTGGICCYGLWNGKTRRILPSNNSRCHSCQFKLKLDYQLVGWLIRFVSEKIGIFEAKTKLSELCSKVAESGAEYVITRRGRAIARIVAPSPEERGEETGILSRMRKTERESGPIPADEADFPEVWEERWGRTPDPLEENADLAEIDRE